MSSTTTKKPFYLFPPWNILFEFNKLEKLVPWNINIAFLLRSFLENMNRTGEVDFRASGVALDSSALIYLMKSRLLLKLEEPPPPPKPPMDYLPPPLFLPLRHELTSTTIRNLLEVLDDVLKGEQLIRAQPAAIESFLPTPSEILPQLDLFLMEIEVQMAKLYAMISDKVKGAGIVEFSTLIKGVGRLEAIRTFILLLFLAQEGKVGLWQNEETEEIYIAIGDLKLGANGEPYV
jgi:chromatin segregation and condensation protein Rec8/ScpA/Scc1 (kleisin family)